MKQIFALVLTGIIVFIITGNAVAQSSTTASSDSKQNQQASNWKISSSAEPAGHANRYISHNWAVSCVYPEAAPGTACELNHMITLANSNDMLIGVTIRSGADSGTNAGDYSVTIQLPHGLNLSSGVELQIDDTKTSNTKIPIQTSNLNGVFASSALSKQLIGLMQNGHELNVKVVGSGMNEITIPVPLKGFTAAFKKM